ncbi:pirin family protein [Kocuria palustris]|nr:pirin family protein [Kocuria palustris]
MANKVRSIEKVIEGIEQDEGAGARVRRLIGNMERRNFNPFLMFDHFKAKGAAGFPEHPHYGMETITYCVNGGIAHEDFTGKKGIIYPGDLQFMTAGKGIVHSEMPIDGPNGEPAELLQMWVDLPAKLKESPPRYRDLREWEIPRYESDDGKLLVKVVSGKSYGVESLHNLAYTPVHYYHFILKKGAKFSQEVIPEWNYFLYVIKGKGLDINGTKVHQYENVFFNRDGNYIEGEQTGDDTVEFIIVGGEMLDQTVVQHGPFVACSRDKIMDVFQNYQYAQNGFENRKSWKTLISNGVTQDMVDNQLGGNLQEREKTRKEFLANQANKNVNDEL